ncbi:hypothetical protein XENOCAPTIV_026439 [Xenoophorus captivus]|uniref:Uncharacterized protein n=1 Tax=Xenoophorus captivus TaxID=1517983 RepID=A0ABV0QPC9_9TELE
MNTISHHLNETWSIVHSASRLRTSTLGRYVSEPPCCDKVLHFPEAPAEDVHEKATYGCRGPADAGVAVNIYGVAVFQEAVEQEYSLGKHPDPTFRERHTDTMN